MRDFKHDSGPYSLLFEPFRFLEDLTEGGDNLLRRQWENVDNILF